MKNFQKMVYEFGKFRLDAEERILSGESTPISLPPKVFDTLLFLVQNSGRVLSKERMLGEIWEDSFVEENNLAQNISVLRRVLGESKGVKFIETVPKFGYRFVAGVRETGAAEEPETEVSDYTRARVYLDEVDR